MREIALNGKIIIDSSFIIKIKTKKVKNIINFIISLNINYF